MKKITLLQLLPALVALAISLPVPVHAAPKDYSGQDLQNKNFKDENLNGANFQGANLQFANFNNATCKNANFRDADLRNARFKEAMLEGADFTGAKLAKADFWSAKARSVKLAGCEIYLARAEIVSTKGLNLDYKAEALISASQEATSGTLTFHYADMRNCLVLGNAEDVDFRDADLRGADLSKAENLDKARLKGAKYDENTLWKIDTAKAGVVLAAKENAGKAEPGAAKSPFVGKWLIIKGVEGAKDSGVLKIRADHTYEWDPALSADKPDVLSGKWSESGDNIVLDKGELGQTWTATRATRSSGVELQLKSDKNEVRVAAQE